MSLLADLQHTRFARSDGGAVQLIHPEPHPLVRRSDSVYNPMTGLGGSYDKGAVGRPNQWVLPLSVGEQSALYGYNGIARRIVDIPASRACRRGWSVPEIRSEDRRLQTWGHAELAMQMARLHGGSIMLLVTEDDVPNEYKARPLDWLRQPLDLERVGRVLNIPVFDAVEAQPSKWDRDIRSINYRGPAEWQISADGFRATVHASRVIWFRGARRPPSETRGWNRGSLMPDDSCLQAIWDEIRRLTETLQGGAVMAQELRESVLKIGQFSSKMTGDEGGELETRLSLMARVKGLLGMTLIGEGDDYQNRSNPPTGFSELSSGAWEALAAVTGIPQVILMGSTPGGLNTDGESSWEGFRQLVSSYQESQRHELERLYTVLYAAQDGPTRGQAPEDWELTFAPLDEPNESTIAETRQVVAETDVALITAGVLTPAEARRRYSPGGWLFDLTGIKPTESVVNPVEGPAVAVGPAAPAAGEPVPVDPPTPVVPELATGAVENLSATALNGAQVTALVDIVVQVAAGSLPRDAAIAIVQRAFQVDAKEADELLGSAGRGFVPTEEPAPGVPPRFDAASPQSVCILVPAVDPELRQVVESAIGQTIVPETDPHVTVLYLGDVDPMFLPEIVAAVTEECADAQPGTVERPRLRPFPHGEHGQPIVLEFEDAWSLASLHDRLLVRLAHIIVAKQHARYRPHLTIGYAPLELTAEAMTALVGIEIGYLRVPVVEVRVMRGGTMVASSLVGG